MKTTHLIDKTVDPMIRIADAIEEILQLVKADQERSRKYTAREAREELQKDEVYIETLNGPELRDDGTNYK